MRIQVTSFEKPKNLTKAQKILWDLREEMKLSNILGDHNRYVKAQRAYMKEFVAHPNDAITLPPTPRFEVPLFSGTGLNMLKVAIKEFFRKRTPEEKELAAKMMQIKQNGYCYV